MQRKIYEKWWQVIFPLAGCCLTFCCTTGPRAERLSPPAEALQMAAQQTTSSLIQPSDCLPIDWWTVFQDDQLSDLIQKAFVYNPSIQKAHASIDVAAANAERVRAALYPNISFGADASRQKLSKTGVIPFGATDSSVVGGGATTIAVPLPSGSAIPAYFSLYETELRLNYDFDIWQKNRNRLKEAIGEANAKVADEAFVRLQIGIAVAELYYKLQIGYQRQKIALAQIQNRKDYLDLVKKRIQSNLDNADAEHWAEIGISQDQEVLLQIQGQIAINEAELKAYIADFDSALQIAVSEQPLPIVPFPTNLPMHLLGHRPDIISQLWIIYSAGREIEVAKAGFYPDFNLSAFIGFQTIHLQKLFQARSSYWDIDPAINLPIFDGGILLGNLHDSESKYDLAVYEYNRILLNAVQEVVAGLAVLQNSDDQLAEYEKQTELQHEIYSLTSLRVANNLSSGLDQLNSEANVLAMRDQELVAKGNALQAILELIKALGGGYEGCYPKGKI